MNKIQNLVVQYVPLANKLAYEAKKRSPNSIDLEDLRSSAYLGLVEAASRFKEEKNYAFSTFAYRRISGSIYDFLRKQRHLKHESSNDFLEDVAAIDRKNNDDFDNMISFLDERGKIIFKSYFIEDMSMKDISVKMRISESRISQLMKYYKKIIIESLSRKDLFCLN